MADKTGVELIADERARHYGQGEGFSAAGDDKYTDGQLAFAAACYAMPPSPAYTGAAEMHKIGGRAWFWPFGAAWWKPGDGSKAGRIRELVKAGALIAAEIDRLQRGN